ncbi:MAG: tetratricopeptide repeat protein [Thiotrichales bacterium]|jgi:hypothetical protein|nr:tetratricopeptide repeat protein [Thiotrichales bacterium]
MLKNILVNVVALTMIIVAPVFADEDASMQQVYQAAKEGRLAEAQSMMDKVLKDHPNSAKAHYVEAELLAKQGQLSAARGELEKAEQLKPGLPFVNPQSLEELKTRINASKSHGLPMSNTESLPLGLSWSTILLLALLLIGVVFIIRKLTTSNANQGVGGNAFGTSSTMPNNYNRPMSNQPMPQQGYQQPPVAQPASGMGSGIMSGLVTGAAVGAGIVAGEALAHHFVDGDHADTSPHADNGLISNANAAPAPDQFDMGGFDFGMADDSSAWDDDASSISDDDSWS